MRWNGKDLVLEWARKEPEIPMYVAGYGPRALGVAGRVGDGIVIQLADPEITKWIIDRARAAAVEAGRDPDALAPVVCAPAVVDGDLDRWREETRWFPAMVSNHVKDLITRYGTDGEIPSALTDFAQAVEEYDYQRPQPGRRRARQVHQRRDRRPLLPARRRRPAHRAAA